MDYRVQCHRHSNDLFILKQLSHHLQANRLCREDLRIVYQKSAKGSRQSGFQTALTHLMCHGIIRIAL